MRHLIKAHSKPGGEQCLYCPFRYLDILSHIDNVHTKEKNSTEEQVCQKCIPSQKFSDFNELLKHTRSYHRKKHVMDNHKKSPQLKVKELCENCGKLVRHKNSDCPKLQEANVDNIPENQGNLLKSIYNKTIRKLYPSFNTIFYNVSKWFEIAGFFVYNLKKKSKLKPYMANIFCKHRKICL
jgi:hypothetical protein